jgi:hyaluronan synthase
VHQAAAQADSMFPDSWTAFFRQRVRWSRNSYRAYLTAAAQGWLWRQPLITQVTVLQVLVTPLSMGAAIFYTVSWAVDGGWVAVVAAFIWAVVGRALRGLSHLRENPRDLAISPLMAVVVAVIALPIKVWAAISMNRQGWLTRNAAGRVQGQREITAPAPSTTTTPTSPEVRRAT